MKKIDPIRELAIKGLEKGNKALELAVKFGIIYYGYQAFPQYGVHGPLVGLIGLELAKSQNMIGGASGVAILAGLGLTHLVKHTALDILDIKPPVWFTKTNKIGLNNGYYPTTPRPTSRKDLGFPPYPWE